MFNYSDLMELRDPTAAASDGRAVGEVGTVPLDVCRERETR